MAINLPAPLNKSAIPVTFLFLLLAFSSKLTAQTVPEDSLLYQKAIENTVALYHKTIGNQSALYNGSQYVPYSFKFKNGGHPFFYQDVFAKGSIIYDNVLYPDIQLLYDEVGDFLILKDSLHYTKLISQRITGFSILSNQFIRIEKDSLSRSLINTGFYNLLYAGKVMVLKKEVKTINEEAVSSSEGLLRSIQINHYYYIKKNNEYFPIRSKKLLLAVFKDQKNEIQQFIKSNNLNFRRDKDIMLAKVSAFYDQLIK